MLSVGLNNLDTSISKPLSSLGREILAHGGTEAQAEKYTNRREAIRAGALQCTTCANRKYQDGSDEQVSFKSAQHVSPEAAGARVRGHEQEHVNNAYDKAKEAGGKVGSSVSKNTDFIITNDTDSNSSKMVKAKALGIPVWNEEELYKNMK